MVPILINYVIATLYVLHDSSLIAESLIYVTIHIWDDFRIHQV